jgi:hypothetical protein
MTTVYINEMVWHAADQGETGAAFCRRMGWGPGAVVETFSKNPGKGEPAPVRLYRIVELLDDGGVLTDAGPVDMAAPGFLPPPAYTWDGARYPGYTRWPWRKVR